MAACIHQNCLPLYIFSVIGDIFGIGIQGLVSVLGLDGRARRTGMGENVSLMKPGLCMVIVISYLSKSSALLMRSSSSLNSSW